MNYTAIVSIFFLMPLTVILNYFLRKTEIQKYFILVVSLFFYLWFSNNYFDVLNIFLLTFVSFVFARTLLKIKNKYLLLVYIFLVILNLCLFKYQDYFIKHNFIMPLGLSFISFQAMSYVIDVYKSKITDVNILNLFRYLWFFPTTFQGPIIRYLDFIKQNTRTIDISKIAQGYRIFIIGLAKKSIIANSLVVVSNHCFNNDVVWYLAWIGAISYALMLYYDFSGYSDMAKGVAKMLGYDILDNFNYPYISKSVSEFWRRWHISLGLWFKDYVYIVLGGSRKGVVLGVFNLFVVWILTGIWHGSSYNFIVWGLYFFVLLSVEKYLLKKSFGYPLTMFLILISWVIFNSSDPIGYLKMMFNINTFFKISHIKSFNFIYLWPIYIFAFMGITPFFKKVFLDKYKYLSDIYLMIIFCLSIFMLINSGSVSFGYVGF